jgi:hypothetical protein
LPQAGAQSRDSFMASLVADAQHGSGSLMPSNSAFRIASQEAQQQQAQQQQQQQQQHLGAPQQPPQPQQLASRSPSDNSSGHETLTLHGGAGEARLQLML